MPLIRFAPLCWVLFPSENFVKIVSSLMLPASFLLLAHKHKRFASPVIPGGVCVAAPLPGHSKREADALLRLPGLSWFLLANSSQNGQNENELEHESCNLKA